MARTRNRWGWGFEDAVVDARAAAPAMVESLGFGTTDVLDPQPLRLPARRLEAPAGAIWSADDADRAAHSLGKSYIDTVRALRGDYERAVDLVARPRDAREVEDVLAWAGGANAAVIPYGGGTSVVGGVEPRVPGRFDGVVSLDLGELDALLELDVVSRAARIGAGASGPRVEELLRPHDLTLRFFPQSFERSTLGGWIATRAGGHFATGPTHIDDVVEAVHAITPSGAWASRRLPGSGAGPSPDRMLLGSEGILGVVCEAWVRVQPRPRHRAGRTVRFGSFLEGAEAVRAVVQAGLAPANVRLIDALEAQQTGAGDGERAVLVLAFESVDHPVDHELDRALVLCREAGGAPDPPREGSGGAWREAFIAMPYLRDALLRCDVLADTFETAITWERLPALHREVTEATEEALGLPCRVTCRLTHAYPDGAAPYFTVLAPTTRGAEIERWWAFKRAASDAVLEAGGTITHHHAVGRDHREWYDRQRPEPFALALRAAKAAVDPRGLMNPGVLLDA
ncbi:MAG: FAD-binding oxidoreductase [Solirubrobacteraceae bacterium]